MENLNSLPLQVIILLCISIGATLLVVRVLALCIGFEEKFNPGKFSQDIDNENLFFSPHFSFLFCWMVPGPEDRKDLIMINFSLPHNLTAEDMSSLMKYVPQLEDYVLSVECPDSDRIIILQKSEDIYWGDIRHKILEFFFCKLYKEYGYEVKEEALEIGVT